MAEQKQGSTALVSGSDLRDEARFARITGGGNIKNLQEMRERIAEVERYAFILTPMSSAASLAPGYELNPTVIWIDPSVDAKSGRGANVYHQPSIHKAHKQGGDWVPDEVSINHDGLMRILNSFCVNVHPTRWLHDGVAVPHLFVCESDGDLIDFTADPRWL